MPPLLLAALLAVGMATGNTVITTPTPPPLESLRSAWVPFAVAGPPGGGARHTPVSCALPPTQPPGQPPIDCPSISNTAGSVGSCEPGCPDLLSFNSFTGGNFISGTCPIRLSVGGCGINVAKHQWLPYEVSRVASAAGFDFVSSTRLLDDGRGTGGILMTLAITPQSPASAVTGARGGASPSAARSASSTVLDISLAPEVERVDDMPWNIQWPTGKPRWQHTLAPASNPAGGQLLVSRDTASPAATALGVVVAAPAGTAHALRLRVPTGLSNGLGALGPAVAIGSLPLAATGPTTLRVFVVLGNSSLAARHAAQALASQGSFDAAWATAAEKWQERWQAAFTPGNKHYSGVLPTIALPGTRGNLRAAHPPTTHSPTASTGIAGDGATATVAEDVARIYYMACVTLLACERTNYPLISPRVYVTGFGTLQHIFGGDYFHGGSAAFYWDQSLLSNLNTLLDPRWMRDFLVAALAGGDFSTNLFIELLNNKGAGGYWYAFNTISVFWMLEGYLRITDDQVFLHKMPVGGKSIAEWMEHLALLWTDPKWQAQEGGPHPYLADYGGNPSNFLECIPTYTHTVAALQAQNAKMLRVVADMHAAAGNATAAATRRQQAAAIAEAVETKLYIKGAGYFGTIYPGNASSPGPKLVGVRTCLDFMYVAEALAEQLAPQTKAEMCSFFAKELQRPHWMVALSELDPIAKNANTRRDDHGWTGAYNAWPALSFEALAKLSAGGGGGAAPGASASVATAVAFLASTAAVTHNGPYGQADWVRPAPETPFKDDGTSGTRYTANNGAAFAEAVLRTVFGYQPAWGLGGASADDGDGALLWARHESRGMNATLHNLRLQNGSLASICSTSNGVAFC